jgi:hypothetical protein
MCPTEWGIDAGSGGSRWGLPKGAPELRGGTQGQKRHSVRFDGAASPSCVFLPIRNKKPNLAKAPPSRGVSQGYAVSLEPMGLGYAAETRENFPDLCPTLPGIPSLEQLARRISTASFQDMPGASNENAKHSRGSSRGRLNAGESGAKGKSTISNSGKSHRIPHHSDMKSVEVVVSLTDRQPIAANAPGTGRRSCVLAAIPILGISRSIVNQVAAEICRHKKPDPYNAKGIGSR